MAVGHTLLTKTALAKLKAEIKKRVALARVLVLKNKEIGDLRKESAIQNRKYQDFLKTVFLLQEEDRKEISRELHDEISQVLIGINFELSVLSKEAQNSSEAMRDKISKAQELVGQSVETIHRFATELRPMILDDLGLIPAIRSYAKDFSKRNKIPVNFEAEPKTYKIEDFNKTVLFRIAQESLANIAKHAQAKEVWVNIKTFKDQVELKIKDNGVGFNPSKVQNQSGSGRIGLIGMRERIKLTEGTIEIVSAPNKGTVVVARVPVVRN